MTLKLSSHGTSFATRGRARELMQNVAEGGPEVHVDLAGAVASPSFLAELLGMLAQQFDSVVVTGASDHLADVVKHLARQLDLERQVRLAQVA